MNKNRFEKKNKVRMTTNMVIWTSKRTNKERFDSQQGQTREQTRPVMPLAFLSHVLVGRGTITASHFGILA